jgi:hypothetical protein
MSIYSLSPAHDYEEPPEESDEYSDGDVHKLWDTDDGGAEFAIMDGEAGEEGDEFEGLNSDNDFYANLALDMDDGELNTLAAELMQEVKTTNLCLRYLGLRIEEFRDVPFMRACAQIDSTMLQALIQAFATAWAELFPAAGPVKSSISGTPNNLIEDQGERVKLWMNYFLTQVDEGYYPDSEQLLWYVIFFGSAFRKTYIDPITKMPCSRMIKPMNFIVNPDCTNLLEATRQTHVFDLTRREVKIREEIGDFKAGTLPNASDSFDSDVSSITKSVRKIDGINPDNKDKRSVFTYYEIHVDLDPNLVEKGKYKTGDKRHSRRNDAAQRCYIVTINESNKKVAAIRRGWEENDEMCKRENFFTNYYYLRGFGIYGLGIAHLLGSDAITLTSITRQVIDATTLKMFPGGVRRKGMKMENNDKAVGPAEFIEMETGEMAIQDCLMLMPYSDPPPAALDLMDKIAEKSKAVAGTAEAALPDGAIHVSEGTTLAVLDVANKVQSTVLRSLHFALGTEFKIIFKLFGKCLPEEPYPFSVPGRETAIMRSDFNDLVNISPVSDPNVLTSTHRMLRSEALLKLAQSNPEIHDLREAYHRMYSSMNIENIDQILPPAPQPASLDPITENMLILSGKEVVASFGQDHESHITLHQGFHVEQKDVNPPAYASAMSHIQEHKCLKIVEEHFEDIVLKTFSQKHPELMQDQQVLSMQKEQLMQLPEVQEVQQEIMGTSPKDLIKMPEVQNIIAKQDAKQYAEEQKAKQEQEAQTPQPIDLSVVGMADVEQKREAAHLKSETDKLKVESESFKAQLKFEGEQAKIESQNEIAEDKNKVNLAIAQMKSPNPIYPE